MAVLVMRLEGPWQSWGVDSRYERRDTLSRPSASGLVGLLANALGRGREQDLADLVALPMGCRTERAGRVETDFHTAQLPGDSNSRLSRRMYLADAAFLAALEGPQRFLEILGEALQRPARPLFLGRRACPPQSPIFVRVVGGDAALAEVLQTHEAVVERVDDGDRPWYRTAVAGEAATVIPDQAVSFSLRHRRHTGRPVTSGVIAAVACPQPDHFEAIGG